MDFKNAKYLLINTDPRYWEDSTLDGVKDDNLNPKMPCIEDVEGRKIWKPKIDIAEGRILDWIGVEADICYKICDAGHYELLDENNVVIANADDWEGGSYVPTILDCSEEKDSFGDYIQMSVDSAGKIKNWKPDFRDFHDPNINYE
jgi:hypothetical protein